MVDRGASRLRSPPPPHADGAFDPAPGYLSRKRHAAPLLPLGRKLPAAAFGAGPGSPGPPAPAPPHGGRVRRRPRLGCPVELPLAAERAIPAALRFEVDRRTPFKPGSVHLGYRVRERDTAGRKLKVDLVCVPKRLLDPMREVLHDAGRRWTASPSILAPKNQIDLTQDGDPRQTGRQAATRLGTRSRSAGRWGSAWRLPACCSRCSGWNPWPTALKPMSPPARPGDPGGTA